MSRFLKVLAAARALVERLGSLAEVLRRTADAIAKVVAGLTLFVELVTT